MLNFTHTNVPQTQTPSRNRPWQSRDTFVRKKNAPEATQMFGLLSKLSKLGEEQMGQEMEEPQRRKEEEEKRAQQKKERLPERKKGFMHEERARKKESMKLSKDKWLEIMELAASSKGWLSMQPVDIDTSDPPEFVQLSRPFAIEPWNDSEENVGNLLMIWTILITFAEVLVLRPFTLEEFVQAFHDDDSRLLGEIHVALLSCIVKNIEDAGKTPSMRLGTNRNNSANPGGGHPQIVEGAYAWGFDIHSWQQHLNLPTWPEVLRQFALSAGFGPQLKTRSLQSIIRDDNEGHKCEHIVSTLRNSATAAAAVRQEKGLSQARRSGHRLTPGTLKFAAFHVLSLEGSMGLSKLELVDKIKESGLWDFTESKTPETSVGTTLSRELNLFERTAPSTYCVRAEFRNDPNDADAILSTAREEIRLRQKVTDESVACLKIRKRKNVCNEVGEILQSGHGSAPGSSLSSFPLEGPQERNNSGALIGQSADLARNSNGASTDDLEDAEIDERNTGEPWVRELMKGTYADLTAEKRLNALVALIGVAVEGNSVCVILEEWLEAANAFKKQMWEEAQLDKRRMKEECITKPQSLSFMGTKTELNVMSSVVDGSRSPFGDSKNNEASLNPSLNEPIFDPSNTQIYLNNMSAECNVTPENYQQQHAHAAAEKMHVSGFLPLGQDRKRNRYWQFVTSASEKDPLTGRIFYESQGGCWRLIDTNRESHLHLMLQKVEVSFKDAVRRNSNCKNHVDPSENQVRTEASEIVSTTDRSAGKGSISSSV